MADHMTAEQLRAGLATISTLVARLDPHEGDESRRVDDIASRLHVLAARLSALPAQGVPDSPELVGWYRAYDMWRFGQKKPDSSRYEFQPGIERPNIPDDAAPGDWEPVYLLGTVPPPPAPKAKE